MLKREVRGMEMEKIFVEFGVEGRREIGYGVEEVFLTYNGEPVEYKAVVKNGELVALVKRGYKVIPNELFVSILQRYGVERVIEDSYRVAVVLRHGEDRLLFTNSIDGSLAVQAFLILNDSGAMIKLNVAYRRHTKGLIVENIAEFVNEAKNAVNKYKELVSKLSDVQVDEEKVEQIVKLLSDAGIPNKYLNGVQYRTLTGVMKTLKDVYEVVAKNISANSDLNIRTRIAWFNKLNEVVFAYAGVELL